eukprot:1161403-Pelagomonas_calceolata.AAC.4
MSMCKEILVRGCERERAWLRACCVSGCSRMVAGAPTEVVEDSASTSSSNPTLGSRGASTSWHAVDVRKRTHWKWNRLFRATRWTGAH